MMHLIGRLKSAALIFFLIIVLIKSSSTKHHGRRHKRQHGAHLYLPESYIIPGGEGNPQEWGPWGSPSECSRTCGGGVAHQTRECISNNIGRDGAPRCAGGNIKYFSCNSQDCPESDEDYRHYQCSLFDTIPFEGIRYEWVPFTKAPNPCELNCMPRGERFYYRHKAKVIDGTRCNDESLDVCVDGLCQPVGCDLMLGSTAKEDKCRKCTGDGSSCKTINGLLDMNNLQVGYNDILLIPSGATNIKIQEISPSNNYLAIRNLSGNYYLNGNWRIDFPRPMTFADAIWHYDRRPQGLSAPDHLSCMGPTSEPVYLVLLYQDRNVGIEYEYSVPEGSAYLAAPDTYSWTYTEYEPCSVSCGSGFQTRNVTCNSRSTLETVDDSLCDPASMPANTQQCGQEKCPPKWIESEWSKCSTSCGTNGTQTRNVHCERIISTGVATTVDDQVCLEQVGNKPADINSCNVGVICPEWHIGPWQPCNKLCGEGSQKRQIKCYRKENGKINLLLDSDCVDEKPEDTKSCMLRPCEGVDWITTSWTGCKTCGLEQETRTAHCATKSGEIFNDTFCVNHKMPELSRPCDAPACNYQWFTSQWSKCSAECGKGVQTRRIVCAEFDGENIRKTDDEKKCDKNEKPIDEKECEVKSECPGQWFTGPWSECSKKCGGGQKVRKVLCISNDKPVPAINCNQDNIEFSSDECNKDPCLEDDVIPVDVTSKPIEEDDEGEEWCDEDSDDSDNGLEVVNVNKDSNNGGVSDGFEIDPTKDSALITDDLMLGDDGTIDDGTIDGGADVEPIDDINDGSGDDEDLSAIRGFSSIEGSGSEFSTDSSTISTTETDTTDSSTISSTDYSTDSSSSTDAVSTDSTEPTISTISVSKLTAESKITDTIDSSSSLLTTSSSDGSTESTITTEEVSTQSTESTSEKITESSTTTVGSSTISSSVGSTDTTESIPTDTTQSTESTVTDTTESTESTITDTTESTITDTTASTESTVTDTTESTVTDTTGSTVTDTTESTVTETTGSTESTVTDTTESTVTDTTESTVTETTESTVAETTESTVTETTESTVAETTESTVAETTESTVTDTTESTQSTVTDTSISTMSSETTELSSTDATDSTDIQTTITQDTTESEDSTTSSSDASTDISSTDSVVSTSEALESTTDSSSSTGDETTDGSSTKDLSTTSDTSSTDLSSKVSDETTETITTDSAGTDESPSSTDSSIGTTIDIWSTTDVTGTDTDEDDLWGSTPNTLQAVVTKEQTPRKCKPRPKVAPCLKSKFGCCQDNTTSAKGPFDEGCPVPKTCKETRFGCCPDGLTPAQSKNNKGCPEPVCEQSLFGCCPDGITESRGNDDEGCPIEITTTMMPTEETTTIEGSTTDDESTEDTSITDDGETESTIISSTEESPSTTADIVRAPIPDIKDCARSEFGCCPDGLSEATGPNYHGCEQRYCNQTEFGCCHDNYTPASGPNNEGCSPCLTEPFRCCPDGVTPAHGPNGEGCCLESTYGCCPDNLTPARGPNLEGCECDYTPYGCCPDGKTAKKGYDNLGCGCEQTQHGCCPDKLTAAQGEKYAGCPCHTFQFGCCPDGVTVPKGPHNYGCHCSQSEFKCCSDDITPATGPNFEGCTCATSKYGCCLDGITDAKGANFEGCDSMPPNPQKACSLKKEGGNCTNFAIKNFFDIEYGGCSRFWYSGCGGNENRFETVEECKSVCEQPDGKAACLLPKIQGPCTGYYPSFYYDSDRNICSQFIYGGCLGTNNRFDTIEACQSLCVTDNTTPPCDQPMERGPCYGNYQRWYFDKESDTCQPFTYGGCSGNKNNYATENACNYHCKSPGVHKDSCRLPIETGNCYGRHARWYFSDNDNKCMPFYYSGCEGNKNNFESEDKCAEKCPKKITKDLCDKPAEVGECQNYTAKWYYDTKEERCRQFYYGGCGGNDNRFNEQDECIKRCEEKVITTTTAAMPQAIVTVARQPSYPEQPQQPEVQPQQPSDTFDINYCYLEYDQGPCRAREARYYYNKQDGICDMFAYGGCQGNENNFRTVEDCEAKCGHVQDTCALSALYGRCQENITRWHYDAKLERCTEFSYSGCRGNRNNFYTESECMEQCRSYKVYDFDPRFGAEGDDCTSPVDYGNCSEDILSYYFNTETNGCEEFSFTGCGGNANRYESLQKCEEICGAQNICQLEYDAGPCDNKTMSYYYDVQMKRCLSFEYGGCEGNANRFDTLEECEVICGEDKRLEKAPSVELHTTMSPYSDPLITSNRDICLLPVEIGNCGEYQQDHQRRWYYDDARGSCVSFIYTGCNGNRNNFESLDICIQYCNIDQDNRIIDEEDDDQKKPNICEELNRECESKHCPYGVTRTYDSNGCERCECENPCQNYECDHESRCSVDIESDPTLGTAFRPVCRKVTKPGECPKILGNTRCDGECYTDADCRGDNKCCDAGCGYICVAPYTPPTAVEEEHITSAPVDVQLPQPTRRPRPHAPVLEERSRQEIDVVQPEGDVATLRCFATGYPLPTVSWRRGAIIINTDQGRYVLTSTGDLQIIQVHRSDSGTYVCVADNGIGVPVQREVNLTISDPVRGIYILGESNSTKIATFNRPITMRCLAGGYPKPHVTWWRGTDLLPLNSKRYEVARDNSLTIHSVQLSDLGPYTCQSYSGYGKALSIYVTLKAYGPVPPYNLDEEKFVKYVVPPIDSPITHRPYIIQPQIPYPNIPVVVEIPKVPVMTRMLLPLGNTFAVGADVTIQCEIEGYPTPSVTWYKDNVEIQPSNRTQISESHRLLVLGATTEDSGFYKCFAKNDYGQSHSESSITIQGVYVPLGCDDNPYFANCALIIKAKYCNHQYYAKFCCRSCTLAGQLNNHFNRLR